MIVQQLGGSSEGYTMKVAGVHAMQRGEHAVLFLRPARANGGGTWTIVGLMQGHFRIYAAGGHTMAGNGLQIRTLRTDGSNTKRELATSSSSESTVSVFTNSVSANSASSDWGGPMTIQELESRVRGALNQ
jgi:hypothetical protein